MIDGHIDSIPLHSKSRWTVDPFGGEVRDGVLYGLGICDQKASIASAIWGVAAAAPSLRQRVVVVASVCEEEMEGGALAEPIATMRPDFFVTSEPNDTRLCVGQRGRAKVEVQVTGRACHAGHAAVGLNAAHAMAALIGQVAALEQPTHPRLGVRDLNCIDLLSDPYPSVSTIPGRVTARFDCRFLPGESPESIVRLLTEAAEEAWSGWSEKPLIEVGLVEAAFRTWTGEQFSLPEYAAAWWTPEDSALVSGAMTRAGIGRAAVDADALLLLHQRLVRRGHLRHSHHRIRRRRRVGGPPGRRTCDARLAAARRTRLCRAGLDGALNAVSERSGQPVVVKRSASSLVSAGHTTGS